MAGSSHETEIKLKVSDLEAGRRILRQAGFRIWKRRVFESNTIFDTPDGSLRRQGALIRIRRAGRTTTLTYKGVAEAGRYKSREELEVELPNADTMEAIFDRLGYRPFFRYEKYRTEYKGQGGAGVATLDETPIGVYLELEGKPSWIDRTAELMGFEESQYVTASYARLYLDWCRTRKVRPQHMVF